MKYSISLTFEIRQLIWRGYQSQQYRLREGSIYFLEASPGSTGAAMIQNHTLFILLNAALPSQFPQFFHLGTQARVSLHPQYGPEDLCGRLVLDRASGLLRL